MHVPGAALSNVLLITGSPGRQQLEKCCVQTSGSGSWRAHARLASRLAAHSSPAVFYMRRHLHALLCNVVAVIRAHTNAVGFQAVPNANVTHIVLTMICE